MPVEVRIPGPISAQIGLLDGLTKQRLVQCLRELEADPFPDGQRKQPAPPHFPYVPSGAWFECEEFVVAYRLVHGAAGERMAVYIEHIKPLPAIPPNYRDWPIVRVDN